ncbi:uncharacterized protein LOC108477812 [Gossypium arboreum]|uniref:uncharacterized protein LOC108477812 n=1 Tax=Gossypium arboreum TaxID=29729 RepID=UPI0008196267|nr:uncharacterized protein LOC108477812 [Gossypium arboreum]
MGDIKMQIGIGIPINAKNNPRRKGKEHVKAITLRLGKVLSSPKNPTSEVNMENADDPQEKSLETENELELEEKIAPAVEPKRKNIKDDVVTNISFPLRPEEKKKKAEQEEEAHESEEEGEEEEEEYESEEMDFEEGD